MSFHTSSRTPSTLTKCLLRLAKESTFHLAHQFGQHLYRFFFVLLFLLVTSSSAMAQSGVDESVFQEVSKEVDYSDTRLVLLPRARETEVKDDIDRSGNGGWYNSLGLFEWVAYLLIAVVLIFILYSLLHKPNEEQVVESPMAEEEFEDVHEIDANQAYLNALEAGDFRLAIRMQFVKVMQQLSGRSMIKWMPEKTNRQYIREMHGNKLSTSFREITHIYEWVWYGNTTLRKHDFERYNDHFVRFINTVTP